jgi:hypothetical protein
MIYVSVCKQHAFKRILERLKGISKNVIKQLTIQFKQDILSGIN